MRTYLADIIPKIRRFSQKLDHNTLLTDQHWVVINELKNSKLVYIFRSNQELLISQNGKVERGKWEYLGNNSLLLDQKNETYLFKQGFFDANVMALKVDGKDEFAFFVNESKYGSDLNSVDKVLSFLESKYLKIIPTAEIESLSFEPNTYVQISDSVHELNPVRSDEDKYGFADKEGKLIIHCKYNGVDNFSEGMALVYISKRNRDHYGYIDEDGNEIIPLEYEYGESFSEGLALVRLNRKFGFINRSGEIVIPLNYDYADSFEGGKARVKVRGRLYYIDRSGSELAK